MDEGRGHANRAASETERSPGTDPPRVDWSAKRGFRRVSEGQDAWSERPTRWHGLAPTLHHQPLQFVSEPQKLLSAGILIAQRLVNFGFHQPPETFCCRDQV